jgi:hypothetical protein
LADAPAKCKLSKWPGSGAYLACGCCLMQGVLGGERSDELRGMTSKVYFRGYKDAIKQTLNEKLRGQMLKVGDANLKLTHEDHVARAECVDSRETTTKEEDCNGLSPIIEFIPYVDYNNIWIVPLGHAFLFGVVSHVIHLAFQDMRRPTTGEDYPVGVIPHVIRKVIATRGSNLRVTSEFGRRYKDVEKYKGSYTMEDWLHFILAFSPYLLCPYGLGWEGPKAKIFQEMWQYLVDADHHYFHGMQDYSDDKSKKNS